MAKVKKTPKPKKPEKPYDLYGDSIADCKADVAKAVRAKDPVAAARAWMFRLSYEMSVFHSRYLKLVLEAIRQVEEVAKPTKKTA